MDFQHLLIYDMFSFSDKLNTCPYLTYC